MGAVRHPGGYRGSIGGRSVLLYKPDLDVAMPSVEAVGQVEADENGRWLQAFVIGEPTAGYEWRAGAKSRQKLPILPGAQILDMGPSDGLQEDAQFSQWPIAGGRPSQRLVIALTYPGGSPGQRPTVINSIGDQAYTLGATISIATAGMFFSETTMTFAANFEGDTDPIAITPGWSINSATGVITGSSSAALDRRIVVRATNAAGFGEASFGVTVAADPLRITAAGVFSGATPAEGVVWTVTDPTTAGGTAPRVVTVRFLRDGVPLGDYGAVTSYTYGAADKGHAITAGHLVTDDAGATVPGAATGVGSIPADPPGPTTIGSIADVDITPGATITRTAAGIFQGTGTPVYTMTVDGLSPPVGYSVNSSTGAIALPNVAPVPANGITSRTIVIIATYGATGAATDTFTFRIAPALRFSTNPTFSGANTNQGTIWTGAGQAVANAVGAVTYTYRRLRNGTAINATADSIASHTIGPGDYSSTITLQVTATDSSTPPQTATVVATGSAVVGAAPVVTADFTVNNTAELLAAMVSAAALAGPRVISCNPGDYAALTRTAALVKAGSTTETVTINGAQVTRRVNLTNRVTVRGLNRIGGPGAPTRFRNAKWTLSNLSGFDFENIHLLWTPKDGVNYANTRMNSKIGGLAGFPDDANLAAVITACDNMKWRNCKFEGAHRCFSMQQSNHYITHERCNWVGIGLDCVSYFGDRNTKCDFLDNQIEFDVDIQRSQSDAPNRHPDSISFQGSSQTDIRILRNTILMPPGYCQGPFCPDQPGTRATWTTLRQNRITIQFNFIRGLHGNGIFMGLCADAVVSDNVIREYVIDPATEVEGPGSGVPVIKFKERVEGECARNVMPRALFFQDGAVIGDLTGTGTNVISATAWPTSWAQNAPYPCGMYSDDSATPTVTAHTVTSAPTAPNTVDKVHPTRYTSTITGTGTQRRRYYRNGVLQTAWNDSAFFDTTASQQGRLLIDGYTDINGVASNVLTVEDRIGRLMPTLLGQSLIDGIATVGGASVQAAVPTTCVAGDRVYVHVGYPQRSVGLANTSPIAWFTGAAQIGSQIEPQAAPATGADITDIRLGWAWFTLTATEINSRLLPAQYVGAHGMAIFSFVRNASDHRLIGPTFQPGGTQTLLFPGTINDSTTIETSLLLVGIGGSDYPNNARRSRMSPLPNAVTSDYLPGIVSTNANQIGTGRWTGIAVMTREVGGGSAANKVVAPIPAITRAGGESMVVSVLEVVGPA